MTLMQPVPASEKELFPVWSFFSSFPEWKKDEVHVWRSSLQMPAEQTEMLRQTLSSDELQRAGCFRFQRDSANFIAARGTLRAIIGRYLNEEPRKVRFRYGLFGKPELANEKTISFNVSHSKDLAVFAFARNRKVGVDIEYISSAPSIAEIAGQFLMTEEGMSLKPAPGYIRKKAFFRAWTRNEAYLKAIGTGFAGRRDLLETNVKGRWSFTGISVGRGYAACLAVEGPEPSFKFLQWMDVI